MAVRFRDTAMICTERLRGHGRRRRADRDRPQPVPRHRRAARRAGARGQWRRLRARGRAGLDAAGLLHRGRVQRAVRAAARQPRLGGPGRAGADDPLRLLGAPEPRARDVRQVHVEHGRRLPRPDPPADGPVDRAGGHGGVRAGPPVRAGGTRRFARPDPLAAGAGGRRTAHHRAPWTLRVVGRGDGRRTGRRGAPADPDAARRDAWRGGAELQAGPLPPPSGDGGGYGFLAGRSPAAG